MHKIVKKHADNGDIKSLKYMFVDCLDADPTFEDYREDFEYCRNIPGLFEDHIELTPFCSDSAGWDEDYWIGLKKDLLKNFSIKRFQHMRKVAEVFYKEKICRIQREREQKREVEEDKKKLELKNPQGASRQRQEKQIGQEEWCSKEEQRRQGKEDVGPTVGSEQQKREPEEDKKSLELKNPQGASHQRQEEQCRNLEREKTGNGKTESNASGKKVLGAVLIVIVILIVILLIIRME